MFRQRSEVGLQHHGSLKELKEEVFPSHERINITNTVYFLDMPPTYAL